jgi:transketolase C-terminal domain/subunit
MHNLCCTTYWLLKDRKIALEQHAAAGGLGSGNNSLLQSASSTAQHRCVSVAPLFSFSLSGARALALSLSLAPSLSVYI